jgi:hypothetical protein
MSVSIWTPIASRKRHQLVRIDFGEKPGRAGMSLTSLTMGSKLIVTAVLLAAVREQQVSQLLCKARHHRC